MSNDVFEAWAATGQLMVRAICCRPAGYGDFSPSITASQMTLLAMLFVAFTLLPYQVCLRPVCGADS